ncbi:gamma-glutamylcyclotransferase family protein [Spirillospora sp. CA-255316]
MNHEIGTKGLFVYGTLRFPEILEILLGRVPRLAPAAVTGWRVRALPGVTYPGLVADPDATAEGVLISGLTEAEQRLLDAFEGDPYEPAVLPLAGGAGRARAYVWRGATEPYDWDPGHFAEHALAEFAESCRAWLGHRP